MSPDPNRLRLGAAHRARVTAEHVGCRVTIRHLVEEDGRQRPTDVLGHLRSWEDDVLRVERRDGSVATIDATTVIASRVIPEPPPRRGRSTGSAPG